MEWDMAACSIACRALWISTDVPSSASRCFRMSLPTSSLVAQHRVLAPQARTFETAGDGVQDLIGAKRLQQEIAGAGANRLDRGVQIGMCGDHDRVAEEADLALLGKPFQPGLVGHDVVENDHVIGVFVEKPRGIARVRGDVHPGAVCGENFGQEVPHARLVIDDEHGGLGQFVAEGSIFDCGVRRLSQGWPAVRTHGQTCLPKPAGEDQLFNGRWNQKSVAARTRWQRSSRCDAAEASPIAVSILRHDITAIHLGGLARAFSAPPARLLS
ncbi:hypothetical protein OH818_24955 [Jiella pelagia]|uniref:Uncharacterized protein n=1 Tax=Jiella pelagia TaxID=2986949 RepID=A0ABY7C0G2_9HYPH|nr:hypothetical protein [Jiella pelagia]WAP68509.1 hypothetical protein OH818_24955 [Jiella pelagia]